MADRSRDNLMSETKQGRTYIDWKNMKKQTVQIDAEGNLTEIELPDPTKPRSLQDLLDKRAKRMGR